MVIARKNAGPANALLATALAAPEVVRLANEIDGLEALVEHFYRNTSVDDLTGRDPIDLIGAVVSQLTLARTRAPSESLVRVATPTVADDGWTCEHTVVEVVTDDMPFIVDSVCAALNRAERTLNLVIHPIYAVRRDAVGGLVKITPLSANQNGAIAESWLHIEIDRESDSADITELTALLRQVLADVRVSVQDWPLMATKARELAEELASSPPPTVDPNELAEAGEFLKWIADDHFTFLGYREYDLVDDVEVGEQLVSRADLGLGLLRGAPAQSTTFSTLTPQVKMKAREPRILVLTKANRRSTVHRPVYLDYVGVKAFDADGNVVGERRFIGLLTSSTYADSATAIPVVRRTIRDAVALSGFSPRSHSARDLMQFCQTYPRDELFQITAEQLIAVATEVLAIGERKQTRVFLRNDDYGRFASVLVYLPRDHFTTHVRGRIELVLTQTFGSSSIDFVARVSESVLARLHFVVRMPPGVTVPDVDVGALADRVRIVTRRWGDAFNQSLIHEFGEEQGWKLIHRYGPQLPEAYKEDVAPRAAAADVARLDALTEFGQHSVHLHETLGADTDEHRFTLYRLGAPVQLFELLPVFASLGAEIIEQRPYQVGRSDGMPAWIYDVKLRLPASERFTDGVRGELAARFCAAFLATWQGDCEADRLNALVTATGITWTEVSWLRAFVQYARQLGSPFSLQYFELAVLGNPDVASLLVDLFRARLDPELPSSRRDAVIDRLRQALDTAIDAVKSLDADRILRQLLGIVEAVLRTNAFQHDSQGCAPITVAIKVDSGKVPHLPAPIPHFEIWATSPRFSGVHLRFGRIARGGLRWSDRPEDMRTEILGLAKAQMVKNAVIVPVGAKGGFFVKAPRDTNDREIWRADGIACYREFVRAMLSITDNRVGGQIVAPVRTVRWDGDDSYLVVAADKGTASFSDIANEIALAEGFWLGDAFASGGSHGYDHKQMGITARGAWESVSRHFRDLGVDIETGSFTVAGIGDMSGDVFGNGMLLTDSIRLVAAFDHRHIFLDPDPDGATSLAERRRLFELPRSSWADYNPELISAGGGVYARSLKEIPISDEVRTALGLPETTLRLLPDELVTSILLAPVELLWNGGIGTYVKATSETDQSVGDKANDAVRVNGADLRVRVVGEGGNLGLTQLGRVEAAEHGVQLNTDAIDNCAGVDCSDHEVNIKIALDAVVADGDMTLKLRNQLLVDMTGEVAQKVLATNYSQNQLLGTSRMHAAVMVAVHRRLMSSLVDRGLLDRELECLPTDDALAQREAAGQGLTSPELAVLISYVKIAVTQDLVASTIADEPWYDRVLQGYFPDQLAARAGAWIVTHPLRQEIVANTVANELVDSTGVSFVFRTIEETGASTVEVARAYTIAREVFNLPQLWTQISAMDGQVATRAQDAMALEIRRLLDRATRWVLSLRGGRVDVGDEIERLSATVAELSDVTGRLLVGSQRRRMVKKAQAFIAAGAPDELAYAVASSLDQFSLLDIDDMARRYEEPLVAIAEVYFAISEHYGIDTLLVNIAKLPRGDRWSNMARAAARSDLYSVLAGLTSKVLRTTSSEDVAESRIAQWEQSSSEGQQRARATLAEIDAAGQYDLATLSVALRVLRTLVKQGTSSTPN